MPISNGYVVQYLVQATRATNGSIAWREKEDGGFTTSVRGIKVDLDCIADRTSSRFCLTLANVEYLVRIHEPQKLGIVRPKYSNEDEERLAALMRELAVAATRQCATRANANHHNSERIRETLFRRVVGLADPET